MSKSTRTLPRCRNRRERDAEAAIVIETPGTKILLESVSPQDNINRYVCAEREFCRICDEQRECIGGGNLDEGRSSKLELCGWSCNGQDLSLLKVDC
ncbi:hypothetical protein RYX36_007733 [Vicia faba]